MKNSKIISDYTLERYLLGELPPKDTRAVEEAMRNQAGLKQRLNTLKKSSKKILQDYPGSAIIPEIQRRLSIEKDLVCKTRQKTKVTALLKKWYFYPSLAASCAIAIIMITLIFSGKSNTQKQIVKDDANKKQTDIIKEKTNNSDLIDKNKKPLQLVHNNTPYYGIKGFKTEIIVHRKKGKSIETLTNGAVARKNDLIQLAYKLPKKSFGVIISIDGRGAITVHHPLKSNFAVALLPGRKVNLPTAFELDDAPYFERFFLITAKKNFSITYIKTAAKKIAANSRQAQLANLPIAKSLKQVSVLIIKGK